MKKDGTTPWQLRSNDPAFISPDQQHQIEYGEPGEIAMSGPWSADALLVLPDGRKLLLSNMGAGPPVWQESGRYLALPVWNRSRQQQLMVVDVIEKNIRLYAQTFSVLELETFQENLIEGINSPIYRSSKLAFDITKEAVQEERDLT